MEARRHRHVRGFLENALEVEADALSDGEDVFVPAIMEHIEQAGIHSGDSACVIPPVSIPPRHMETILDYTRRMALDLGVVGLMNIQYAIADDTVYVLEANPRASRTVPLVSKVCNVSMARIATQLMLGTKLADLNLSRKTIPYFGVKEAVLPFNMFPEVDPVLGPEMRSTGEVLGLDKASGMAFFKSQDAAQQALPLQGVVLMSVSDREKPMALEVAREFRKLGFTIRATEGTRMFLDDHGVESEHIRKQHEGRPNIVDGIKNNAIQLVINSPVGKLGQHDDSYIRQAAKKYKVPYITTMRAALAAARGIADRRSRSAHVCSLQEYHQQVE